MDGYFRVKSFKEKPDVKTAEKYLTSSDYLWNSGMYIFNLKIFERELEEHSKDIFKYFEKNYEEFSADFEKMPAISIDCAISEKSKNIIVFEGDFGWSDIGSFDALAETLSGQKDNKKYININSKNIFAHSNGGYLIAASGVEDLIIIENNDFIISGDVSNNSIGLKNKTKGKQLTLR